VDELGRGQDHVAYLTAGNMVVRVASGDGPRERIEREALLLTFVAELTELPVPRPTDVDPEAGSLSYERLPGVPLIALPEDVRGRAAQPVARELGGLLKALHGVDPERVREMVDRDVQPLGGWLEDAADEYEAARPAIPKGHRGAVERFLDAPPPPPSDRLVFSHNDLGIEHVLVDPESLAVTGIIDWSDAALCDPAHDYGLIFRDLGSAGRAASDTSTCPAFL
jgi:aminoglycoside phosphotransferase (APT) family kinase protein